MENMFECIYSSSWRKMLIAGSFMEPKIAMALYVLKPCSDSNKEQDPVSPWAWRAGSLQRLSRDERSIFVYI